MIYKASEVIKGAKNTLLGFFYYQRPWLAPPGFVGNLSILGLFVVSFLKEILCGLTGHFLRPSLISLKVKRGPSRQRKDNGWPLEHQVSGADGLSKSRLEQESFSTSPCKSFSTPRPPSSPCQLITSCCVNR